MGGASQSGAQSAHGRGEPPARLCWYGFFRWISRRQAPPAPRLRAVRSGLTICRPGGPHPFTPRLGPFCKRTPANVHGRYAGSSGSANVTIRSQPRRRTLRNLGLSLRPAVGSSCVFRRWPGSSGSGATSRNLSAGARCKTAFPVFVPDLARASSGANMALPGPSAARSVQSPRRRHKVAARQT